MDTDYCLLPRRYYGSATLIDECAEDDQDKESLVSAPSESAFSAAGWNSNYGWGSCGSTAGGGAGADGYGGAWGAYLSGSSRDGGGGCGGGCSSLPDGGIQILYAFELDVGFEAGGAVVGGGLDSGLRKKLFIRRERRTRGKCALEKQRRVYPQRIVMYRDSELEARVVST